MKDTTNEKNTIGRWQDKRTEIFKDRADEISGYNISGVGQNIPLNKAGADWYRNMGADVEKIMGDNSFGKRGESAFNTKNTESTPTVVINNTIQGSVISEKELEKKTYDAVEDYYRRFFLL